MGSPNTRVFVKGINQMQQAAHIVSENFSDLSNAGIRTRELHDVLANRLPSLHRGAYRLLRNTADAEDAVQDALLSACRHLGQFRGESRVATWLTAIVFNSARMRLRHRRRYVHVSLDEQIGGDRQYPVSERLARPGPSPEDECRDSELTRHVSQLMAHLSPIVRRTLKLRVMDDLSIRETAAILGLPTGTVKARLARAKKQLQQLMKRSLQPRLRGRRT